jgi:hypothetical protein
VLDGLEVLDAGVVVVLPEEQARREVARVHVAQDPDVGVPPAEADVEAAHARDCVVHNHQLLVCESDKASTGSSKCDWGVGKRAVLTVAPHESDLATEVVGVAHDCDVLVHVLHVVLGVR